MVMNAARRSRPPMVTTNRPGMIARRPNRTPVHARPAPKTIVVVPARTRMMTPFGVPATVSSVETILSKAIRFSTVEDVHMFALTEQLT